MLAIDLSQLDPTVRTRLDQLFRADHQVSLMRAMAEQKRLAQQVHQHRPRSVDGVGEQTMILHPYLDVCNRAIVGSHRWSNDRELRAWYLKKYPEARVRSTGTRDQVGYTAPAVQNRSDRSGQVIAVSGGTKRFTRVYA